MKWKKGGHLTSAGISAGDRLSPMLVFRILPMRIYSDLSCSFLNGHLSMATLGDCCIDIDDRGSVGAFLLGRMFNPLEFEEVRKLAAELCGRLHPQLYGRTTSH